MPYDGSVRNKFIVHLKTISSYLIRYPQRTLFISELIKVTFLFPYCLEHSFYERKLMVSDQFQRPKRLSLKKSVLAVQRQMRFYRLDLTDKELCEGQIQQPNCAMKNSPMHVVPLQATVHNVQNVTSLSYNFIYFLLTSLLHNQRLCNDVRTKSKLIDSNKINHV